MVNPWKSIPIKKEFLIPEYVKKTFHKLEDAGFVVYFVGGAVRDFLLGRQPKDFDLVTDATPDEILELFPHSIEVGKKFGVIKTLHLLKKTKKIKSDDTSESLFLDETKEVEVATFRCDGDYHDGRRPTQVTFGDPFSDVLRRDFTINGLLFDYKQKRILDAIGGVEDLKNGLIRSIGDPLKRFDEDALRLLRAVRFAARFDFKLEDSLKSAIGASLKKCRRLSNERIREELKQIFLGEHVLRAFHLLNDLGLLREILPEYEAIPERLVKSFENEKEKRTEGLFWTILFLPIFLKTDTFNKEKKEFERLFQSLTDRFKLSKALSEEIYFCLTEYPKFNEVFDMREATLLRWLKEPHFPALSLYYKVLSQSKNGNLMAHQFCENLRNQFLMEQKVAQKLLTGDDLIEMGFSPSKAFSKILKEVEDLQYEGKMTTKDEAIHYVLERFLM